MITSASNPESRTLVVLWTTRSCGACAEATGAPTRHMPARPATAMSRLLPIVSSESVRCCVPDHSDPALHSDEHAALHGSDRQARRARSPPASWPPGDRLPSVRRLAADEELAPSTVQRAYLALADAGVVVLAGAAGGAHRARRRARRAAAAARRRDLPPGRQRRPGARARAGRDRRRRSRSRRRAAASAGSPRSGRTPPTAPPCTSAIATGSYNAPFARTLARRPRAGARPPLAARAGADRRRRQPARARGRRVRSRGSGSPAARAGPARGR